MDGPGEGLGDPFRVKGLGLDTNLRNPSIGTDRHVLAQQGDGTVPIDLIDPIDPIELHRRNFYRCEGWGKRMFAEAELRIEPVESRVAPKLVVAAVPQGTANNREKDADRVRIRLLIVFSFGTFAGGQEGYVPLVDCPRSSGDGHLQHHVERSHGANRHLPRRLGCRVRPPPVIGALEIQTGRLQLRRHRAGELHPLHGDGGSRGVKRDLEMQVLARLHFSGEAVKTSRRRIFALAPRIFAPAPRIAAQGVSPVAWEVLPHADRVLGVNGGEEYPVRSPEPLDQGRGGRRIRGQFHGTEGIEYRPRLQPTHRDVRNRCPVTGTFGVGSYGVGLFGDCLFGVSLGWWGAGG
jgi:hypothetical protein